MALLCFGMVSLFAVTVQYTRNVVIKYLKKIQEIDHDGFASLTVRDYTRPNGGGTLGKGNKKRLKFIITDSYMSSGQWPVASGSLYIHIC